MGLVQEVRELYPAGEKEKVFSAIHTEIAHYIGPLHGKSIIKMLWDLQYAISQRQIIRLRYAKLDGTLVERKVFPMDVVCSEFYFYLIAFHADMKYEHPAFYRLDRMDSFRMEGKSYRRSIYQNYHRSGMRHCGNGGVSVSAEEMVWGYHSEDRDASDLFYPVTSDHSVRQIQRGIQCDVLLQRDRIVGDVSVSHLPGGI